MEIVEILLSAYNGGRHLSEQLNSIENQNYSNWILTVRDDGSDDNSPKILENFYKRHSKRVCILQDSGTHFGVCQSYSRLMEAATANYIMFCDQDDAWLQQKIDKTLLKMKQLETEKDSGVPLLVHCNLMVTDESMALRHNSFWAYQGINPKNASRLNRQLVMNVVTGCSMMINRALLNLAMPISHDAMVHDWWIAQTAAAFGEVGCVHEPLVLYRQHGENQIGARRYKGINQIIEILKNLDDERRRYYYMVQGQLRQGKAFYDRYKNAMSVEQKELFNEFFRLYKAAPFYRFLIMAKNGFWRSGILRNIAMGMMLR